MKRRSERDYTVDGDRIRALRLRKIHWRQEDLAKATGLQTGTVSRIDTGFHQPQLATIARMADAFEVELDDLVEWYIDLDGDAA